MPILRHFSLFLSVCAIALAAPALAAGQQQSPSPDPKTLLLKSLEAAGGVSIYSSFKDFIAQGTVTGGAAGSGSGQATVRGAGDDQLRLDFEFNGKATAWAISHGNGQYRESEAGKVNRVASYNATNAGWLTLPYVRIATALTDSGVELKYVGLQTVDGNPVYVVRVIRHLPKTEDPKDMLSALRTADYYLDPSTLRILQMVDSIHPNRAAVGMNSRGQVAIAGTRRQITYSDYRQVNGTLVPYTVSETVGQQLAWTLQLNTITFNSGQSDSDFQIQ